MTHTIRVDIVSAEAEIYSGEATLVVATGELGELGIAPRHAPLITRLKPGHVDVVAANGERQQFYVSGGILEVQPQVVTILADTAARAADLDEAAALKAKEEAEAALANRGEQLDVAEAQAKLAEALAQLQALERMRKTLKQRSAHHRALRRPPLGGFFFCSLIPWGVGPPPSGCPARPSQGPAPPRRTILAFDVEPRMPFMPR